MQPLLVDLDFGSERREVGTLEEHRGTIYFEFAESFLKHPLPISPLRMPVQPGLVTHIPAVFAHNLPSGWSAVMVQHYLGRYRPRLPDLQYLQYIHNQNIGALTYSPLPRYWLYTQHEVNPFEIAQTLKEPRPYRWLRQVAGSLRGHTPKIAVSNHNGTLYGEVRGTAPGTPLIVKLEYSSTERYSGKLEHATTKMAQAAGVRTVTPLLLTSENRALFASERFDTDGRHRAHVQTAEVMLGSDATPEHIIRLAFTLTEARNAVLELFRRAVFAHYSGTEAIAARKVAFLMDAAGSWTLAPAYGLRVQEDASSSLDLHELGAMIGVSRYRVRQEIARVREGIAAWRDIASAAGLASRHIRRVQELLESSASLKKSG